LNKKAPIKKKLKLNTETVRHLNNAELKNVVGEGPSWTGSCPCHMTDDC
jgi:hypothetical protein